VIGSKKTREAECHNGIVRANKWRVNDYFSGGDSPDKLVNGGTILVENVYNRK
jgi:hypothetical protein